MNFTPKNEVSLLLLQVQPPGTLSTTGGASMTLFDPSEVVSIWASLAFSIERPGVFYDMLMSLAGPPVSTRLLWLLPSDRVEVSQALREVAFKTTTPP